MGSGSGPVPEAVAVPFVAFVSKLQVNVLSSESMSVAFNSGATQEEPLSSVMTTVKATPCTITGASFTGFTVTATVTVSAEVPSETCTTKLSPPL